MSYIKCLAGHPQCPAPSGATGISGNAKTHSTVPGTTRAGCDRNPGKRITGRPRATGLGKNVYISGPAAGSKVLRRGRNGVGAGRSRTVIPPSGLRLVTVITGRVGARVHNKWSTLVGMEAGIRVVDRCAVYVGEINIKQKTIRPL